MSKRRLVLTINWPITLLSACFFPLLMYLGCWQYDRGVDKSRVQEQWRSEQGLTAIAVDNIAQLDGINFRRVRVQGSFDVTRYWLLENQMRGGRVGVHMIMPFRLTSGGLLLVNRGWLSLDEVERRGISSDTMTLSGTLKSPSNSVLINEVDNVFSAWPHTLLEADIAQMNLQYDDVFYPSILLLDSDSPAALDSFWQPINLSPERHTGYAVQWWLMAFALVVLWLFANLSRSTTMTINNHD